MSGLQVIIWGGGRGKRKGWRKEEWRSNRISDKPHHQTPELSQAFYRTSLPYCQEPKGLENSCCDDANSHLMCKKREVSPVTHLTSTWSFSLPLKSILLSSCNAPKRRKRTLFLTISTPNFNPFQPPPPRQQHHDLWISRKAASNTMFWLWQKFIALFFF